MSSAKKPTQSFSAEDVLRAANDSLREENMDLRSRLEAEQSKYRQLLRERTQEVRDTRVTERQRSADVLKSSNSKLCEQKQSELAKQKELLTHYYHLEIQKIIRTKDELLSRSKAELTRQNEELAAKLQNVLQQPAQSKDVTAKYDVEIGKLKNEVAELRSNKRHLEEQLQTVIAADRQKANDIRMMYEQHQLELGRFNKDAKQEVVRLVSRRFFFVYYFLHWAHH